MANQILDLTAIAFWQRRLAIKLEIGCAVAEGIRERPVADANGVSTRGSHVPVYWSRHCELRAILGFPWSSENSNFSRSPDQLGAVQNSASTYQTSFNTNLQYGPSLFDRTHVFNVSTTMTCPQEGGISSISIMGSWIKSFKGGIRPECSGPQPCSAA